jgi:hypothetical protein
MTEDRRQRTAFCIVNLSSVICLLSSVMGTDTNRSSCIYQTPNTKYSRSKKEPLDTSGRNYVQTQFVLPVTGR